MAEKVKLPRATLEQKIAVLDFFHARVKEEGGRTSQADIVKHFRDKIAISTSSFSEWVKHEDTLRQLYNLPNKAHRRSKRRIKFKYEEINHEMDMLVQRQLKEGKPVTEPFLREHWIELANRFGVNDPKRLRGFSHGWLTQFKKRNVLDRQSREKLKDEAVLEMPLIETSPQEQQQQVQQQTVQQQQQRSDVGGFGLDEYSEEYMNLQNYESLMNTNNNFIQQQFARTGDPQVDQVQGSVQQQPQAQVQSFATRLAQQQAQVQQQQLQAQQQVQAQQAGTQTQQGQPTISEHDFEMFLDKYGDEFMQLSQDKYPESAKLFTHFVSVFKREKELLHDRKLRELMMRR